MAEPRMALSRCPHLPPSGTGDSVHRCLATGLGCSHGESDSVRSMASTPVSGSHQLVRVRSSLAGLERVQKGSSGEACVVEHGQHHGCSVREQAGGAALLLTVDQGGGPAPVVPRVGIALTAKYVPGKLNILADFLSRSHMILPSEWTLAHRTLEPVWARWFKPHIDLFATRFSRRLPLFVSPVPDPQAWAVDALAIPWTNLSAYAFPPFSILRKVIRKARVEEASLILVAPMWESQPWFPDLLDLCHVDPVQLVIGPRGLIQPRSGVPHADPAVLNLHAWLVCGRACSHEVHQMM